MSSTIMSTEATPRYRNFSNNMPGSTIATPRAQSTLIAIEKEPERDPEEDCFMCRQAHVYVKPIGMHQERRVAGRHPPPLTQAQIDELGRKPHLTKQEVRKLLQCYFPEIKDVKYFQLHKYHSCCYDPKHLNLCKNHITALQRERVQHPDHHHNNKNNRNGHDENYYKDYARDGGQPQQNRVSFVRIKIEPTKGIPTRFLGPTALPESLADMLLKQVNLLENKKTAPSFKSGNGSRPYNVKKVNNQYGTDEDDDDDDDDSDDDDDHDDNNQKTSGTQYTNPNNGDLVVEDLDELNRLYVHRQDRTAPNDEQIFMKPLKKKKRKNGTKKKHIHGHHKPKLNHWELLALQQKKEEPCNCRHHVMRLEADQILYDWCRCKDHQHTELMDRRKSIALPPPSPEEPRQPTPPPKRPPPPPPRPKPRKVHTKSVGIGTIDPGTTELALAYDPATVDYDMIQEVIYYRTSSGRLIKPEITNAFTYDTMPQAMDLHRQEHVPDKAEVLYMTSNGQLKSFEGGKTNGGHHRRGKSIGQPSSATSLVLSNPGSIYNGQIVIDKHHSLSTNGSQGNMPVLKLPPSLASSRQRFTDDSNGYQPAEFILAKFSPDKSIDTPVSRRTPVQSPASGSQGRSRTIPTSMQKSTKPTYTNQEPTPDYGRQSSVVANRRWFDQPLGDQNLRPVHDGQYGLIAGTSTDRHKLNSQLPENDYEETDAPKNPSNCTIS